MVSHKFFIRDKNKNDKDQSWSDDRPGISLVQNQKVYDSDDCGGENRFVEESMQDYF